MSRLTIPTPTNSGRFLPFSSLTPTIYMTALPDTVRAPLELDAIGERVRATWTSGDFGRIAKGYTRGSGEFIARLDFVPLEPVLDLACGTGNLTIPAARAGASVTGIDIAPNLVSQAKTRAQADGLSIRFDVGDVEQLPYANGEFQTVVTMFGAMFAACPDRAAAEMLRVTRSGGRIAMANWTPSGFIGEMFRVTTAYVAPPAGISSPLLWGTEDAVRARLGSGAKSLTLTRRLITFEYPFGPEETVNQFRLWYGPTLRAFAGLDEPNRKALRRDLERLWTDHNRATDGTTRVQSEYLEVLAVVN